MVEIDSIIKPLQFVNPAKRTTLSCHPINEIPRHHRAARQVKKLDERRWACPTADRQLLLPHLIAAMTSPTTQYCRHNR